MLSFLQVSVKLTFFLVTFFVTFSSLAEVKPEGIKDLPNVQWGKRHFIVTVEGGEKKEKEFLVNTTIRRKEITYPKGKVVVFLKNKNNAPRSGSPYFYVGEDGGIKEVADLQGILKADPLSNFGAGKVFEASEGDRLSPFSKRAKTALSYKFNDFILSLSQWLDGLTPDMHLEGMEISQREGLPDSEEKTTKQDPIWMNTRHWTEKTNPIEQALANLELVKKYEIPFTWSLETPIRDKDDYRRIAADTLRKHFEATKKVLTQMENDGQIKERDLIFFTSVPDGTRRVVPFLHFIHAGIITRLEKGKLGEITKLGEREMVQISLEHAASLYLYANLRHLGAPSFNEIRVYRGKK